MMEVQQQDMFRDSQPYEPGPQERAFPKIKGMEGLLAGNPLHLLLARRFGNRAQV